MPFAKLKLDGTFDYDLPELGNIQFDTDHFCRPEALTVMEALEFRVVEITPTEKPTYNPLLQRVERDGAECIDSVWFYKWKVVELYDTEEERIQTIANDTAVKVGELRKSIVDQTMQRLNDFAATRNYGSILSLCTYATDPNPKFAVEGQYGVEIRSTTWSTLYTILDEITAGTRPMLNSFADIEPLLPVLQWPVTP